MQSSILLLAQLERLVQQLTPAAYSRPLAVLQEASLGQHVRHILDVYDCLLRGAADGTIDYRRRRRSRAVEQDPAKALEYLHGLRDRLPEIDAEAPVKVVPEQQTETGAPLRELPSSIGRELMHAHGHAIHHLAIIRIGLEQAFPGFQPEKHLGVAPSTQAYRRQQSASNS